MGESAGVAAAMAVKAGRPLHLLDIYELQQRLKAGKQVLSLKENPYGIWNSEDEIIIDNNMKGFASFTGLWSEEETVHTGRYEMNFRFKPKNNEGAFEFKPFLFKTGKYNVYIWNPSSAEYDSNVPVLINHSVGIEKVLVNQQKNGGKWIKLGTWTFEKGYKHKVTIFGEKDKFVIADAVKFEYVD